MRPQSQDVEKQSNQPPEPGGDPAQRPKNLPTPRPEQDQGKHTEDEEGVEGFGRIPKKDVPSSKGTPPPHQIF